MAAPRAIAVVTLVALASAALAVGPTRVARANGAFPDSLQILLPADRPQEIALATNFGLLISEDAGLTWEWTCEQKATVMGSLYAVGPPPRDRYYGLSQLVGLATSDDGSCSWQVASGSVDQAILSDFFPDPSDGTRVLAIGSARADGGTLAQLFPSHDGGTTFQAPLFTAPLDANLTGVEIARSDPRIIYLAMYTAPGMHPKLVQSADGGQSWVTADVEPMLGANAFRIIAVDPVDPRVLYLRVIEPLSESLAVSKDGGATFAKPVTVDNGVLSAFARLGSGTVLVGAIAATTALGYRSRDGGASFQAWAGVPHLRALAERDGKLYAAAKNYTDFWAIGVSDDEGATFQHLATYDQVRAIRACAQVACADSCDFQAGSQIWPPAVCCANAGDAGATCGATPPPPAKTGCGCRFGGRPVVGWLALAPAAAALLVSRARRRRRASRRGT